MALEDSMALIPYVDSFSTDCPIPGVEAWVIVDYSGIELVPGEQHLLVRLALHMEGDGRRITEITSGTRIAEQRVEDPAAWGKEVCEIEDLLGLAIQTIDLDALRAEVTQIQGILDWFKVE